MACVSAFRGLLPQPSEVKKVAAVPYDVINSDEAAILAQGNMLSFLRVSRPEIEMEKGIDLHDDRVYAKAAENFKRLCKNAPLTPDAEAHLYVYSLKMGNHVQTGIAAAVSTDEYNRDIIKKHEKTRKDKEDDRTRHIVTLRSHTGPVFLTYKDDAAIDKLVSEICRTAPLFDFTAEDGISHKMWKADIKESSELSALFSKIPYLYIADGHHRAAAASRTAAQLKSSNPSHTGKEDYNYFLSVIFPASQLRIMPYNRVVKDLNGHTSEAFFEALKKKFKVSPTDKNEPSEQGKMCMYIDKKWYMLEPLFDTSRLGVIESLDVSILQDNVLAPLLGIDDPRTSKRVDFVGGIRGTKELVKLIAEGKAALAFSMYPTTVSQLMAIADAGEIMPPKSTWFEPKLRDGLVCHNF